MKRKIAAIMAADVAGYSRLVAEDEEETLRRLAAYRAVFDDFVTRGSGRIFITAGDAVLGEFSSAVEAVRCAIDVQESLRTRNMAYPTSRQMNFRIGITIGDVVERDGDLLGDGVNIAARLEGLAEPGGICVSQIVYEQVANKLSVRFADAGEQQVKNIPMPVRAYMVATDRAEPPPILPAKPPPRRWLWPAIAMLACATAVGLAAFIFVTLPRQKQPEAPAQVAVPAAPKPPAKAAPVPAPTPRPAPQAPASQAPAPQAPAAPEKAADALVPEAVPFAADRARATIRTSYMPAPDHKALAISAVQIGFVSGQKDDETAREGALEACQKSSDAIAPGRRCELYALGNAVVDARPPPPMPPQPWINSDPATDRPFAAAEVPIVNDRGRQLLERAYAPARKSKALAVSSAGIPFFYIGQSDPDEAARRALELCGRNAGTFCSIFAVDDMFVVPVPTTMKAVSLFDPRTSAIAADQRDEVARRLADAPFGWRAVAVGADGQPGVDVNGTTENEAVGGALEDCDKHDRDCRVIAIGPFAVEPN